MPKPIKCTVCSTNITSERKKGLDCVSCTLWYHQGCSGLSVADFDKLHKSPAPRWSCRDCDKAKKGRRSSFLLPPVTTAATTSSSASNPSRSLATTTKNSKNSSQAQISPDFSQLKSQLAEFKSRLEALEKDLREEIAKSSQQTHVIRSLRNSLRDLTEQKSDSEEKEKFENHLEIRGLPYDILKDPILALTQVSVQFEHSLTPDSFLCYILKGILIVEFKERAHKLNFLAAGKNFNREGKKFNHRQRIFVNQRLTSCERKLLYEAKIYGKSAGFKFAWHVNGRVHIKRDESSRPIVINSFEDLNQIKEGIIPLLPEREGIENEN